MKNGRHFYPVLLRDRFGLCRDMLGGWEKVLLGRGFRDGSDNLPDRFDIGYGCSKLHELYARSSIQ